MTMAYCTIAFIQEAWADQDGDQDSPAAMFMLGDATEDEAISYLAQWDYGGESEHSLSVTDAPPWGADDDTYRSDEYVLSWNHRVGYIALARVCDPLDA